MGKVLKVVLFLALLPPALFGLVVLLFMVLSLVTPGGSDEVGRQAVTQMEQKRTTKRSHKPAPPQRWPWDPAPQKR